MQVSYTEYLCVWFIQVTRSYVLLPLPFISYTKVSSMTLDLFLARKAMTEAGHGTALLFRAGLPSISTLSSVLPRVSLQSLHGDRDSLNDIDQCSFKIKWGIIVWVWLTHENPRQLCSEEGGPSGLFSATSWCPGLITCGLPISQGALPRDFWMKRTSFSSYFLNFPSYLFHLTRLGATLFRFLPFRAMILLSQGFLVPLSFT